MDAKFLGLVCALAGCAEDTAEAPHAESPDTANVEDARPPVHDSGKPMRDAAQLDSGKRPAPPRACTPGVYEGDFSCVISGLLPWAGKISFALVEEALGAGEFTSLRIVPGTRIMGGDDSLGGMLTADLEGSFDCASGQLTGRRANGIYLYGGVMEYRLEGPLMGTYLSDDGMPGFAGTMGKLTSKDFEILGELGPSAMCTWQAARVEGDAGR